MIDSNKLIDEIISKIELIHESDIPGIDLYMDQVTTFMDTHLKCRKRFEDDKILTKTMINNYAKNDLLPPPVKKRYSKEHVILLIFIYYFKNILSISDIKTILNPICEKYFTDKSDISLEDIYSNIGVIENGLIEESKNDIKKKIDDSKNSFTDASEDDKEFLQLFTLITSLSFDVYLKKQMIEGIVDKLNETQKRSAKDKNDKDVKKNEKDAKKDAKKSDKSSK